MISSRSTIVFMGSLLMLSCNSASSEATNTLSVRMVYNKSLSFEGEDKDKFVQLETDQGSVVADSDINYKQVSISIRAGSAKVEWGSEQSTSFSAPSAKAAEALKLMNIDFYDKKNQISVKKQEVVIWDAEQNSKFHSVETDSNNYDVSANSRAPATKKKQRVVASSISLCDGIPSYDFRFPILESPCQIQSWIAKKHWVPSGRNMVVDVLVKRSVEDSFKSEKLECEYYTARDVDKDAESGRCVSFEGKVPFVLIDTVQGGEGQGLRNDQSRLKYQLTSIDWSPRRNEKEFDFASATLCGASESNSDRWIKC